VINNTSRVETASYFLISKDNKQVVVMPITHLLEWLLLQPMEMGCLNLF
jgi:hypothetical protein